MGGNNSKEINEILENQRTLKKELMEKIDENDELHKLILTRTSEILKKRYEGGDTNDLDFDKNLLSKNEEGNLDEVGKKVTEESENLSRDPELTNLKFKKNVSPFLIKFAIQVLKGATWVGKSRFGKWVAKKVGFDDEYAKSLGFNNYNHFLDHYSGLMKNGLNDQLNNHLKQKKESIDIIPNPAYESSSDMKSLKTSPKRKTNPKTSPKRKTNPKTSPKRKTNPKKKK